MLPRCARRERFSSSSTPARCSTIRSAGAMPFLIRILLLASALGSGAKILMLAGSMSGSFAGMFDGGFAVTPGRRRSSVYSPDRIGTVRRCMSAGSPPADSRAPRRDGGIVSLGRSVHGLHSAASLLLSLQLFLCAAFWLGGTGAYADDCARQQPRLRSTSSAARFGQLALYGVAVLLVAGASQLWILSREMRRIFGPRAHDGGRIRGGRHSFECCGVQQVYLTPRLSARGRISSARSRSKCCWARSFC